MNRNLTDNAWVNRVNELRQMVSDLDHAPTNIIEICYYLDSPDFFGSDEFDDDDRAFLEAEIRRQYNFEPTA